MTQETEREKFEAWLPTAYRQPQDVYTIHNMEVSFAAGYRAALEAKQAASAQAVPDGWQLVPKVPTQEMCDAAKYTVHAGLSVFKWADGYYTMLAVAPQPPQAEVQTLVTDWKEFKEAKK